MKTENENKKLFQKKVYCERNINDLKRNKMKQLPIKYNKLIPFKGYFAICLFGKIYIRDFNKDREVNKSTMNHEGIHLCQIEDFISNPNNKK
jgi:hypothetical protein